MAKNKYKVGDRVKFTFLGESLKGVIEQVKKEKPVASKYKVKYWIFDGDYRYPTSYENIKSLIK